MSIPHQVTRKFTPATREHSATFHQHHPFPSDNAWGIPTLSPVTAAQLPRHLIPYGQRLRSAIPLVDGCWHCFLDDERFERIWTRPRRTINVVQQLGCALTPDFSLYRTLPLATQLWNTYRNRWCGAWWQAHGITVIPTIAWGGAASYDFCFLGTPSHSVVAVATVGVWGIQDRDQLKRSLFVTGYKEMVTRLQPSHVLCYGDLFPECQALVPYTCHPTRWQSIREARLQAQQREQQQEAV